MNKDVVQQYVEYLFSQYVENNTVEVECVQDKKKCNALDLGEKKKVTTNFWEQE